jgi:hypothetical protein
LYAAALRALAINALCGDGWVSAEDGGVAVAAEASSLLRRAAGVHAWLYDVGLPRVKEKLDADRWVVETESPCDV